MFIPFSTLILYYDCLPPALLSHFPPKWGQSLYARSARTSLFINGGRGYQLRERAGHYKDFPEFENGDIGLGNSYFWDVNAE